jgi:hypothetical protein
MREIVDGGSYEAAYNYCEKYISKGIKEALDN